MTRPWKRNMAFILVLCMLLSVMPPMVLAAENESQPQTVTYDFTEVEAIHETRLYGEKNATLEELFGKEQIEWTYEGRSANSKSVQVGGGSNAWSGINFGMNVGGGWVAFRIKSPGEGEYSVTINYQTRNNYGEVQVYQLPGDTQDIEAVLDGATALGTYDCHVAGGSFADASKTLSTPAAFEADKEYIFVFRLPNEGTGTLYATVNGIVLEKASEETVPPAQSEEALYDFTEVEAIHETRLYGEKNATLEGLFADGDIKWTYEGRSANSQAVQVGGGSKDWSGINFGMKVGGGWVAFRIKSPGEGEYSVTINYQTRNNYGEVQVCQLPGDTQDIDAALTGATALGTYNCHVAGGSFTDASKTLSAPAAFEADKEYIFVFRLPNEGTGTLYATVNGIKVKKIAADPDEPIVPDETIPPMNLEEATYNFTEVAAVHGTSFGSENATLDGMFAAGDIIWTYEGKNNLQAAMMGGTKADGSVTGWSGLAFAAKSGGGWVAFRIKSPGTGNYSVTVNYQTRNNYGEVQVYQLPGDTQDIDAALTGAACLGKYDCYKAGGAFADASTKLGNAATFTAGEEYILVFYLPNEVYATVNGISVKLSTGTEEGGTEEEEPEYTAPPAQRNEVKYNFDLGNTDLLLKGETFVNARLTDSVVASEISKYYGNYALDWKYHSTMADTRPIAYFGGTKGTTNNLWNGIRVYAKDKDNVNAIAQHYLALTLRSPGTGTYYMTLDHQMHRYGAGAASIYVLPADTADIAAAIAAGTPVGSVCFDNRGLKNDDPAEDAQAVFTTGISCEAGKEYIVVFASEEAGKQGSAFMYIEQVTLTHSSVMVFPEVEEETPLQTDQLVYDFDLGNTELLCQDKTFATRNLTHAAVAAAVESYYYTGALHWSYHSATPGISAFAAFGGVSGDKQYDHTGLRFYSRDKETNDYLHSYYYAFTIRSPGTGNYKLTLDYGVHKTGSKQGSIYILPGDTTDIAAAIASGKAIGTVNYDNGSNDASAWPEAGRSTYGNAIPMVAGEAYIVVFTSDLAGRNSSRLYIDSMMLTKEGTATPADIVPYRKPEPKPIPAGSTVYDLDLNDPVKGIYKSKTYVMDVLDELASRYASGLSNWKWEDQESINVDTMAFLSTGFVNYGVAMEWIALRIKSPGEGLYTLGMNHAITGNGGVGAVYILPADTENISKAMDSSNRVGKVHFDNDSGVTTVTDGEQTLMGTWEFGSDEEYIVVIEAYEGSPFADDRAYMYISQLFMTPGDIMEDTQKQRVITPVAADAGPIRLLEATLSGTTTKVNGCDYLFMPIEGGKVLVFDLDNNLLIDEVDVPYVVVRGMTVDDDGIVWMVGDSPLIFRYDPYTRTGQKIKRYKSLVPDAASGYDLAYGDGCLYFGIYPTGSVIKYDIAADAYTHYGRYFADSNYACGIAYSDGYVYAGLNGDKDNDGVQTWMIAKIDTKTDKLVTMTDVAQLMPKTGAMFRGAGFAGDLLLMAGDSDQQKIVALDKNTMELVDLGFQGGINYGITEEVDGKVYFVINNRGLFSMDVETRQIVAVPGMQDLNIGVRCNDHSIVEVDDKLYPGINIVTYSARTGVPRIYNVEKGAVRSYNEYFTDELGSSTDLRCIVPGEDGSNELLIGAYNTEKCAIYNTETGITTEFETMGQTDSLCLYKGVLYAGNYDDGYLVRVNMEDPTRNQVLLTLNDDVYDQSRIHTLTAGEDKIFAGSTPDKYGQGGCLAWVDLNTLERYVEQNVVKDQTIN